MAERNMIRIKTWEKSYSDDFVRLNKQWIEKYFKLEKCDLEIFDDPEKIVLSGGEIFFATVEGIAIGCCALIKHDDGHFELGKMAVDPQFQGMGIGYELGCVLLGYAKGRGAKYVSLEANTKLASSIRLYRKLGFKEVEDAKPEYERCDLYMRVDLDKF